MTDVTAQSPLSRFNTSPWIGISTFIVVILMQGLGHTIMILMEILLGEEWVYQSATLLGLAGAVMWYIGLSKGSPTMQTWLGFFAGTFVWTGWVEFSFVFYADVLNVPDLTDPATGDIITKNEYLVMMSSLGVLMGSLVFFFLNKDSKCNLFRWFHRNAHMDVGGRPASGKDRNLCTITAIETIYVVWFCYVFLLLIYDESILGDRHPVVYGIFVANSIWALYLLQRLLRFTRMDAAIRYGIPTAIIAWNSIELVGRWDLFTEIWVHPLEYWFEMSLVLLSLSGFVAISLLMPDRHKKPIEE